MNKKLISWLLYACLVAALILAAINFGDAKETYQAVADEYTSHPGYPDNIPEDLQDKLNHAWKDYFIIGKASVWILGALHLLAIGRFMYIKRHIIKGWFKKN